MLAIYLAVVVFGVFVVGVWRDPRSFSNAVFLGLCLALGALAQWAPLTSYRERPAI